MKRHRGRLVSEVTVTKTWRCLVCHRRREGLGLPDGWYVLQRKTGTKRLRIGVFCSATCAMGGALPEAREERGRART